MAKRLAEPLYRTGRNITAENWFTDIDLVEFLFTKRLYCVGTMKKNKRQIPIPLLNVKGRPVTSSMFPFRDNTTLVSYITKKQRNVIAISRMHFENEIDNTQVININHPS